MKVGANIVLSNSTQKLPNGAVWLSAFRTPSILPVYDEENKLGAYPVNYASPARIDLSEFFANPLDLQPIIMIPRTRHYV